MPSTGGRRDDWRTSGPGGRAGPRAGGKGGRRWVAAALVVALLAGLLASLPLFARKPVEPIVLALPVSEYRQSEDSRWPPNPWAEADARGLRDRFADRDSAQEFQHQRKDAVISALTDAVRRADDQHRPLVVYLTTLGTVAADTPYLLPADARPDDPASWLTLDDVLNPLRRGSTDRLLVLDVRPVRTPRAALPPADVNELIDARLAALDGANDLSLLVLTANTPATGPLAVPARGHTAFGLALEQGIGGVADGWLPNSKNGDITARELAEYAREATHIVTEGAQRPQVYGHAADFRLAAVPPTPPQTPDPAPLDYPPFLEDAWKDVDAARDDRLHARAPRAVRQQTDTALEAERWWLAGTPPAAVQGRYAGKFAAFKAELKGPALAAPKRFGASIASARATAPNFDAQQKAAETQLRGLVSLLKSDTYLAAQADQSKSRAMVKEELGKVKLPPEFEFAAVAAAVWDAARKQPDVKFVKSLVEAIEDLPNPTPMPVAELAALKVIALAPSQSARWPSDAVRQWMDATEEAEGVASMDARGLPLVQKALTAADDLYRDAVLDLCDEARPDKAMAQGVTKFQKARDGYRAARAVADAAGRAWAQVEETRAALADLADRYPHELTRAPGLPECSLRELTDAFTEVIAALHTPTPSDVLDPTGLKEATERLRDRRQVLLAAVILPTTNKLVVLEDALGWPGWRAGERKGLVGRFQDTTTAAVAKWPMVPGGKALTDPPAQSERVYQNSLRDLRNRVDLVRVWDKRRADEFDGEVGKGLRPKPERFSTLASAVVAECREGPRKKGEKEDWMRPLLGWAIPPDEKPAVPASDPARNPEVAARRDAEVRFAGWYAERHTLLSKAVAGFARSAADRYSAVAGVAETVK